MPTSSCGNERSGLGLSRRGFLALGAAGAASALAGSTAARAAALRLGGGGVPLTYFQWVPLGKRPPGPVTPGGTWSDVNAIIGEGGNTLVAAVGDSSLIVDTKNAPFGKLLATREARAVGADFEDHTSRLVINTHHHADHTGGNWAFAGRVPVLAHHAARDRIAEQVQRYKDAAAATVRVLEASDKPLDESIGLPAARAYLERADGLTAADFQPSRVVRAEFQRLNVGEIEVELRHFGPGHTDNDLVVRLPKYNVIHAGDLLFHQRWPYIDLGAGATTQGWIRSVEAIIDLCDDRTIIVPGHGEITDVSGLRRQAEFFRTVREAVAAAIKDGTTREAVAELSLPQYEDYGVPRLRPVALGAVYDELTAEGTR